MKEFETFDAIDIANYFVDKANKNGIQSELNNLKLQKILYYSYAFFNEGVLYKEKIEKWRLGPVVPEVYHSFKSYGAKPIEQTVTKLDLERFELVKFEKVLDEIIQTEGLEEYLNSIFDLLIKKDAFSIVNKTHKEPMWKDYEGLINKGTKHLEYTNKEIREFFSDKEKSLYLES